MQVWVKVCLPVLIAAALACVLVGFAQPENRGAFIVIMAVSAVILAWINYRQVAQLGELAEHLERLAAGLAERYAHARIPKPPAAIEVLATSPEPKTQKEE